jgi:hypothetical protein
MIQMPIEVARTICEMEYVCWSEGIGPDSSIIMEWIFSNYPELKKEFPRLAGEM